MIGKCSPFLSLRVFFLRLLLIFFWMWVEWCGFFPCSLLGCHDILVWLEAKRTSETSRKNRQHQFTSSNRITFLAVSWWFDANTNLILHVKNKERERKTREKRLRQGVLCFGNSIEPKIRGFKWKDNGSWAALCHYLTHSIRFGSSTFPCFQLIHTHTLSLSLILEQYIHHIIFGNVTHESLACGTCHLRNAFHDDYERRRRHRHQMSVLYMVGTRMWWHSYRFLRSAFHTKMKNYTKYLSRFALWMSYLYLAICECVYGNQRNETHFNFSTLDSVVYRCTKFLRASSKYRCCFSHFLHLFRVFVSSPIVSHALLMPVYIPFGES